LEQSAIEHLHFINQAVEVRATLPSADGKRRIRSGDYIGPVVLADLDAVGIDLNHRSVIGQGEVGPLIKRGRIEYGVSRVIGKSPHQLLARAGLDDRA
jgi:hypothetical protein